MLLKKFKRFSKKFENNLLFQGEEPGRLPGEVVFINVVEVNVMKSFLGVIEVLSPFESHAEIKEILHIVSELELGVADESRIAEVNEKLIAFFNAQPALISNPSPLANAIPKALLFLNEPFTEKAISPDVLLEKLMELQKVSHRLAEYWAARKMGEKFMYGNLTGKLMHPFLVGRVPESLAEEFIFSRWAQWVNTVTALSLEPLSKRSLMAIYQQYQEIIQYYAGIQRVGIPVLMAAQAQCSLVVEDLLLCGAPVNLLDCDGCPAILVMAVRLSDLKTLAILSKAQGINPNLQDNRGFTILHHAVSLNLLPVVKALLKIPGINVNLQSKEGQTPVQMAANKRYHEITEILLRVPGTISLSILPAEVLTIISRSLTVESRAAFSATSKKMYLISKDSNVLKEVLKKGGTQVSETISSNDLYWLYQNNFFFSNLFKKFTELLEGCNYIKSLGILVNKPNGAYTYEINWINSKIGMVSLNTGNLDELKIIAQEYKEFTYHLLGRMKAEKKRIESLPVNKFSTLIADLRLAQENPRSGENAITQSFNKQINPRPISDGASPIIRRPLSRYFK